MREDVYVALRRMGDEFRVSIHGARPNEPPRAQQAVTRKTRDLVGLESRILSVWPRADASRHFEPEFEIILPTSELFREPEGDDDFKDVCWISPAPAGGLVQVCVCFSNPTPGDDWPAQSRLNSELLAKFDLRSGSCWIVAITRPVMPAGFATDLARGKEKLRTAKPTFSVGDPPLDDPGTRVQLGIGRNGRHCGWVEASFQIPESAA